MTLDDLTGGEASQGVSGPPTTRGWVAGLAVVLVLGAVLVSLTRPDPGPADECVTPPVEEWAKESPVEMTLEPNPVVSGVDAMLIVGGGVGVPARWQCWDGMEWVDTHYLMRGWAGLADVVEIRPGVTVTWPALEFPPFERLAVTIPDVSPGFYRIEDEVIEGGIRSAAFTVVEVVAVAPTIQSTTTTTFEATVTTHHTHLENVPFDPGPLRSRRGHSVVWTGSEMIVWGGASSQQGNYFADGAAFNPVTTTWRMIAESPLVPRSEHLAEWTGSEMLIVGGLFRPEAAAYDPLTDTWRELPSLPFQLGLEDVTEVMSSVWTGEEMIVWHVPADQTAAYSPETDSWRVLPPVGMAADRGVLRRSGKDTYALGALIVGRIGTELSASRLGDSNWVSLPPLDQDYHRPMSSASSGDRLIVWAEDGLAAAWDPGVEQWVQIERAPLVAFCEGLGAPLEMGNRVLVFGWCGDDIVYDGHSGSWSTSEVVGFGDARYAVWTGTEVLNWSGSCCHTSGAPFTVRAWRWTPPE